MLPISSTFELKIAGISILCKLILNTKSSFLVPAILNAFYYLKSLKSVSLAVISILKAS